MVVERCSNGFRMFKTGEELTVSYTPSLAIVISVYSCQLRFLIGLFEVLPAEFKKIDVLVNNAGLVFGRETVGDV